MALTTQVIAAPQYAITDDIEVRLVDEFRFAVDDLSTTVDEFVSRLSTVSKPWYGDPVGLAVPEEISPARAQLHRLHRISGDLRGALDRLEA